MKIRILGRFNLKRIRRLSLREVGFLGFSILACLGVATTVPNASGATPLPVVHVSGTLSSDATWSAGSVYVVDSTFTIPSGVTLTIDSGSIVKYAVGPWNNGIQVSSGGTLDVNGTNANPVHFTSLKDDSFGGDSAGDGSTSGSVGDYNVGIGQSGGTVNVAHATFEYAVSAIGGYLTSDGYLTVADSSFSEIDNGIGLTNGGWGYPATVSLRRNVLDMSDSTGGHPLTFNDVTDLSGIVLSGTDENTFITSQSAPVSTKQLYLGGTVPTGSTWTISNLGGVMPVINDESNIEGTLNLETAVTLLQAPIDVNGTVNVAAGSIFKVQNVGIGFEVKPGGTLNVNGTQADPVHFTSLEDDSLGGDSTGDGATSGVVGQYYLAISQAGGTTNVTHTTFQYASSAVASGASYYEGDGSLTVTDSSISKVDQGIGFNGGPGYVGSLSLQRDDIDLSDSRGGHPLVVSYAPDLSRVVLSGTDKNTFTTGNILPTKQMYLSGKVPSGATWTVSDAGAVPVIFNECHINGILNLNTPLTLIEYQLDDTGTVNIADGSTVKVSNATTGIRVGMGGSLNVNGTSTNRVHFTSLEDDSLGGDSTGDGATTGTVGQYYVAINQAGGTTTVAHATFQYSSSAVSNGASYNGGSGSLTMTDSSISDVNNGIGFDGGTSFEGSLALRRNSFDLSDSSGGNPLNVVHVSDLSQLILSGSDKNTFTYGMPLSTKQIYVSGKVPTGATWTIPDMGETPMISNELYVNGTLNIETPVVLANYRLNDNGVINISAGSTLKVESGGIGVRVNSGAALNVNGTSTDPVHFTSLEDDSLGGDSTGDGATTGSAGQYAGAIDNEGGTVAATYLNMKYGSLEYMQADGQANLENSAIDHATTGIQINNGDLVYRGSVHNVTKGVYACNWQFACSADIAYVDWGSVDGPFPSGGSLVCGQVSVNPWSYGGLDYRNDNIFNVPPCDGSDPPSAVLSARVTAYQTEVSDLNVSCGGGNNDACAYINTYNACIQGAWDVAEDNASFVLPSGSPISDPVGYFTAYLGAASDYIESQEEGNVTGMVFGVGGELLDQVSTIYTLNGAYNSCLSAAHASGWY